MLTALALPLDLTSSVTLMDRTEVRARVPGTNGPASVDMETTLRAGLTLQSRRLRLLLGWSPRLALWDAGTAAAQSTVANAGQARVEWNGRRARVFLEEVGTYGKTNLAAASASPAPEGQPQRVDPVPSAQILRFATSTTTLAAGLTLHRWTVAARAGYQLSGGADADARRSLPLLSGPFAGASADWAASRGDHVVAALSASETKASSGPQAVLVDGSLTHRHRWSRTTETWLTAGASRGGVTSTLVVAPSSAVYPVAEVGVARHGVALNRVRLSARFAPAIDPLTGLIDQRAQVTLDALYRRGRFTTAGSLGGMRSVSTSSATAASVVLGDVDAGYSLTKLVTVDGGVRSVWQREEATRAAFSLTTLFVGVTLRAPPTRL